MTLKHSPCPFCDSEINKRVIAENEYVFAIRDGFPVTEHHSLIIPKRHVQDYFGLSQAELIACDEMLRSISKEISAIDDTVKGFNIGLNAGEAAGQTVFHCHIHLIPRRVGDVENPRGGVRNIFPNKGNY